MEKVRDYYNRIIKDTHILEPKDINKLSLIKRMRESRMTNIRQYKRLQFFWTKFMPILDRSEFAFEDMVFDSIITGSMFFDMNLTHIETAAYFSFIKNRTYKQGIMLSDIYEFYKL